VRLAGDVSHRQPGAAALAKQPGGGCDQVLAQILAAPVAQGGWWPR
jgi:hypothetical protein